MKAIVNGGSKNIKHEVSIDMHQKVEEMRHQEKEEENTENDVQSSDIITDNPFRYKEIGRIREMIETIVIYHFDKETKTFTKYRPYEVRGYSKVCNFKISDLKKSVSLYYEEGTVRYYYLWLSHEDDEKAIQCFKDHLDGEIKKHREEIKRIEDLKDGDWKILEES
jgi:hypothetical protein